MTKWTVEQVRAEALRFRRQVVSREVTAGRRVANGQGAVKSTDKVRRHARRDEVLADMLDHLATLLAQAQTWRPIETAPKDGTEVLAFRADVGRIVMRFEFGRWCARDLGYLQPTHWMPLPAPHDDEPKKET